MQNISVLKGNTKFCPNDIEVRYHKTTSYGDESLNILGAKIWNHRPSNIQSKTSLITFEDLLTHGLDLNVNVAYVE